ncbi:MAG: hypothetical protein RR280_10325 [Bacteroidaceae bacterium]
MSVDSSSIKNTPSYNGQYDAIVTKVIEGLVDHYKLPHTDHSVLMGTHDIRVNVTLASVEQDFTLGHTTTTSRFVELAMDAIDDEKQYVLEGVTCTPVEFVEKLQGREFALVSKALDLLGIEYTCRSAESFARLINAGEDNFSASYVIAVWEVS